MKESNASVPPGNSGMTSTASYVLPSVSGTSIATGVAVSFSDADCSGRLVLSEVLELQAPSTPIKMIIIEDNNVFFMCLNFLSEYIRLI